MDPDSNVTEPRQVTRGELDWTSGVLPIGRYHNELWDARGTSCSVWHGAVVHGPLWIIGNGDYLIWCMCWTLWIWTFLLRGIYIFFQIFSCVFFCLATLWWRQNRWFRTSIHCTIWNLCSIHNGADSPDSSDWGAHIPHTRLQPKFQGSSWDFQGCIAHFRCAYHWPYQTGIQCNLKRSS